MAGFTHRLERIKVLERKTSPYERHSVMLCLGFVGMGIRLLVQSAVFGVPALGTITDSRATDCPKALAGVTYIV